jgi:hypothetical protein
MRKEGRREGRKEGTKEGRKEPRKEGRKEERKEGLVYLSLAGLFTVVFCFVLTASIHAVCPPSGAGTLPFLGLPSPVFLFLVHRFPSFPSVFPFLDSILPLRPL